MSNGFCPPPTHSIAFNMLDGSVVAVFHLIEGELMYSDFPTVMDASIPKQEHEIVMFNNMGMFAEEMKSGKFVERVDMRSRDCREWRLLPVEG